MASKLLSVNIARATSSDKLFVNKTSAADARTVSDEIKLALINSAAVARDNYVSIFA